MNSPSRKSQQRRSVTLTDPTAETDTATFNSIGISTLEDRQPTDSLLISIQSEDIKQLGAKPNNVEFPIQRRQPQADETISPSGHPAAQIDPPQLKRGPHHAQLHIDLLERLVLPTPPLSPTSPVLTSRENSPRDIFVTTECGPALPDSSWPLASGQSSIAGAAVQGNTGSPVSTWLSKPTCDSEDIDRQKDVSRGTYINTPLSVSSPSMPLDGGIFKKSRLQKRTEMKNEMFRRLSSSQKVSPLTKSGPYTLLESSDIVAAFPEVDFFRESARPVVPNLGPSYKGGTSMSFDTADKQFCQTLSPQPQRFWRAEAIQGRSMATALSESSGVRPILNTSGVSPIPSGNTSAQSSTNTQNPQMAYNKRERRVSSYEGDGSEEHPRPPPLTLPYLQNPDVEDSAIPATLTNRSDIHSSTMRSCLDFRRDAELIEMRSPRALGSNRGNRVRIVSPTASSRSHRQHRARLYPPSSTSSSIDSDKDDDVLEVEKDGQSFEAARMEGHNSNFSGSGAVVNDDVGGSRNRGKYGCQLFSTAKFHTRERPALELSKRGVDNTDNAYRLRADCNRFVEGSAGSKSNDGKLSGGPCEDDNEEGGNDSHSNSTSQEGAGSGVGGLWGIMREQIFLSALLFFIPPGFAAYFLSWPSVVTFTLNFLAIVPQAWLMGKATEELAGHMGQIAGGLLNAWFGNVVEMLLCIAGLRAGELSIVKATLVGSILSNLLLVTGCSFLFGGFKHKVQEFSAIGASTNASLMTLSCLCLGLPTMYGTIVHQDGAAELNMSRSVSFLLVFMYIQYLVFQLGTHSFLFAEDDDEEPVLSIWTSAAILGCCTICCTFCSEFLIHSIEGTVSEVRISKSFIGIILLPIIGNAAEHYTSVIVAMRNKMDLSLACAVGSSCQMALFVTPFTVLVGWALGQPMSLDLHPFEMMVLLLAVLIVTSILQDGYSNWLEGSMLVSAYIVVAIIYYFDTNGLDSPDGVTTTAFPKALFI